MSTRESWLGISNAMCLKDSDAPPVVMHLGPPSTRDCTPRIVRPQARLQAQADSRVLTASPRFIEKSRINSWRGGVVRRPSGPKNVSIPQSAARPRS